MHPLLVASRYIRSKSLIQERKPRNARFDWVIDEPDRVHFFGSPSDRARTTSVYLIRPAQATSQLNFFAAGSDDEPSGRRRPYWPSLGFYRSSETHLALASSAQRRGGSMFWKELYESRGFRLLAPTEDWLPSPRRSMHENLGRAPIYWSSPLARGLDALLFTVCPASHRHLPMELYP